jgi:hypothetical protein
LTTANASAEDIRTAEKSEGSSRDVEDPARRHTHDRHQPGARTLIDAPGDDVEHRRSRRDEKNQCGRHEHAER